LPKASVLASRQALFCTIPSKKIDSCCPCQLSEVSAVSQLVQGYIGRFPGGAALSPP
jgi:hypothetical protein